MAAGAVPSDNLFIADLPPHFDEESIRKVFGAYGMIKQCKPLGGSPKSAALVRFMSQEEAVWIVDNLNGNIPQGLDGPIVVRYADDPATRAAKQGGLGWGKAGKDAGASWGGSSCGCGWGKGASSASIQVIHKGLLASNVLPGSGELSPNALYIANLPSDTSDLDLFRIFASFGPIAPRGVKAMLNDDGSCRGIGFVNYLDSASMHLAIQTLNGTYTPEGTMLIVKEKTPKSQLQAQATGNAATASIAAAAAAAGLSPEVVAAITAATDVLGGPGADPAAWAQAAAAVVSEAAAVEQGGASWMKSGSAAA